MRKSVFIIIFIIMAFLLLFVSNSAEALVTYGDDMMGYDYYTYLGYTSHDITCAWDQSEGYVVETDDYEFEIYNPERKITDKKGFVDATQIVFKTPKTGHWIARIRARRLIDGETPEYEYSEWSESTDPAVASVNGEPRGWWIFTWIAPTGPIIIGEKDDNKPTFFTGLEPKYEEVNYYE